MTDKDIRVFYSNRARCWIIANDYKMRRLMDEGYGYQEAKDKSHGHLRSKKAALKMKENILANKRTKERDLYILKCYMRITDKCYKHYNWVCGLYESRSNKDKKYYYNANRGLR